MRSPRAGSMLIALCLILGCLGCSGCFIECEEITLNQGQSPDGVYGAIASYIDCGAVSGFSLDIKLTTKTSLFGLSERLVFRAAGRFTARFEWPESRRLRVTVTCVMPDQCPAEAVQTVRDALASSPRAWGDLQIDYAFE